VAQPRARSARPPFDSRVNTLTTFGPTGTRWGFVLARLVGRDDISSYRLTIGGLELNVWLMFGFRLTPRADHLALRPSRADSDPHWIPSDRAGLIDNHPHINRLQVSWPRLKFHGHPADLSLACAVPSPTSFWLVTAPADSAGAEQLEDLNQAVGKHVQSTSLVEFPDFKVSIHTSATDSVLNLVDSVPCPVSSDPAQLASTEGGLKRAGHGRLEPLTWARFAL
jgi:hypothetical protein